MKKGKQITTILNNEQLEIFEQYKEENNVTTNYEALRLMIGNLPKFSQNVDNSSLLLSGNVDEDRKLLDSMPKFSTKRNSGKFDVLTKARIKLLNGTLSQESYDLFIRCMREENDDL